MRPLPVESVAGAPPFVLGVSIIRGEPVPVIDAGRLLGGERQLAPTRFVTVDSGGRLVALAVDAVIGVRTIASDALVALPSLIHGAADVALAIGSLDSELLVVLQTARLVPDAVWDVIERPIGAP